MTEDILDLMDERRLHKERNEDRYRELNREIHRECNKAKETWMDERCQEIEDLNKRDTQLMYERVKELTNKRKPNSNKAIKNTEGNIIV